MDTKQTIEKIAKFKENEIGPTEENVKQKIIVPILELLGYEREELEFEYRTKSGGKIDIFIKNVPRDCKVIIDTKNYSENLNDYVEQIKDYSFDEAALMAILANGSEIRIYSPLRGIAFERSLLYSIKRADLAKEVTWNILSNLLSKDNILNRKVLQKIEEREKEIKETLSAEEHLQEEHEANIESIDSDIEAKEDEIEQLKVKRDNLVKEINEKLAVLWSKIGLPLELFKIPHTTFNRVGEFSEYAQKAGRVHLKELVNVGLLRDGQILLFYNTRTFNDEQAQVIALSNKLKYRSDGKIYSISELAKILLIKHGFKRDEHGVAGPKYWRTEEGKLLNDLNEQIRRQRGDRS
jgi:predicted type IV restriction endonuclease